MRPSNRTTLLDAALRLMRSEDGGDITLEAVAREAGITKAGLMYHFATREALLLAIVDHAAHSLTEAMERELAVPLADSTAAQRIRAYASVAGQGAESRGEYAICTEAAYRPDLGGPWTERMGPWFALPDELGPVERARLTTARLAADGLWAAEATQVFPPDARDRQAVLAMICSLTEEEGR